MISGVRVWGSVPVSFGTPERVAGSVAGRLRWEEPTTKPTMRFRGAPTLILCASGVALTTEASLSLHQRSRCGEQACPVSGPAHPFTFVAHADTVRDLTGRGVTTIDTSSRGYGRTKRGPLDIVLRVALL